MKSLLLKNSEGVAGVPIGYTWQSKPIKASLWRLICFALGSGDWHRIHVNPFTAPQYRSNLGGLTFCMDFVLAFTKAGVHKMFRFQEDTELVGKDYGKVKFKRPMRVGTKFHYSFTLLASKKLLGKTWYDFKFTVFDSNNNQELCCGVWVASFLPVERTRFGSAVSLLPHHSIKFVCLLLLVLIVGITVKIASGSYFEWTRQARFEKFLATADPATRNAVLEWNVSLLKRIKDGNHDVKFLEKVGTWEAGFIEWGPGP